MTSLADCPVEIIEAIIHVLQDNLVALKMCSRTCKTLHRLCRKYIFRAISLDSRHRSITSFRPLLTNNAEIGDLVRKLKYKVDTLDLFDDDVSWVLERLHPVQFFRFNGSDIHWNRWHRQYPSLPRALLRLIHSPDITTLRIYRLWNFPFTAFLPCINLTYLMFFRVRLEGVESYEQDYSVLGSVPQLHTFTFGRGDGAYTKALVAAKRSDGLPILDFSHLRTLSVQVAHPEDFRAAHTLLKAAEELETLHYRAFYLADACKNLAVSIVKSSLRRLCFRFTICEGDRDPFCGLCEELEQLAGLNVIEELFLEVSVFTDEACSSDGVRWGRLDAALADGFPMLRQVSLNILIGVDADDEPQAHSQVEENLNKIPEYTPWLSKNLNLTFHFSVALVYQEDGYVTSRRVG